MNWHCIPLDCTGTVLPQPVLQGNKDGLAGVTLLAQVTAEIARQRNAHWPIRGYTLYSYTLEWYTFADQYVDIHFASTGHCRDCPSKKCPLTNTQIYILQGRLIFTTTPSMTTCSFYSPLGKEQIHIFSETNAHWQIFITAMFQGTQLKGDVTL